MAFPPPLLTHPLRRLQTVDRPCRPSSSVPPRPRRDTNVQGGKTDRDSPSTSCAPFVAGVPHLFSRSTASVDCLFG
ncbi:hypothetical protein TYRP_007000, partial [Tyrophagus putrescentiae]